ncbi:MAG: hypothetical protein CR993_03065 [Rhodobacterales bacterium]|nr:MAG: hypothetical protein CR993_03065 [Rhodobacterales bacterium]
MTAFLQKKQSELSQHAIVEDALRDLSDKDKGLFALRLVLSTTDPAAAGMISFAADQISNHAQRLMREAFDRECG